MLKKLKKNLDSLLKIDKKYIDISELKELCKEIVAYIEKEQIRKIEEYEPQINYSEMVLVKGGKYKPSFWKKEYRSSPTKYFSDKEGEVFDIMVGKYITTQDMYKKIMGETLFYSQREGKYPVTNVSWWDALEFCNKLSEKEGLKPVYSFEKTEREETDDYYVISKYKYTNLKINQLNGEIVEPYNADFRKTEGYRLPLEIEWEWFARGGNVAIQNGTFNNKYPGSKNLIEVACYEKEIWEEDGEKVMQIWTRRSNVGLKKANELGVHDCLGNVSEWCYDTEFGEKLIINEANFYKYMTAPSDEMRGVWNVIRGGVAFCTDEGEGIFYRGAKPEFFSQDDIGFRVIRTANPII